MTGHAIAPMIIHRGAYAELVHWRVDGTFELASGSWAGMTDTHWLLRCDGQVVAFDRGMWVQCEQ